MLRPARVVAGAPACAQLRAPAGEPLPGITPAEFEEFRLGLDDFLEVESAEEGLGPGLQRHELRRLPQRAGDRRRRHDRRDARRTARRRAAGSSPSTRPARRCSTCSRSQRTAARRSCRPRPTCSRAACRFRSSAPAWSKRFPTTRSSRSKIRSIATATASAAARRASRTRPPASGASAGSAGRRSTRRCSRSAPMPTATRWASPTTCSPPRSAYGVTAERMRACDPIADPEDIVDPRTRRRGIDNFASFMRFLAPVAREGASELTRDGRAGVRGDRLRDLSSSRC